MNDYYFSHFPSSYRDEYHSLIFGHRTPIVRSQQLYRRQKEQQHRQQLNKLRSQQPRTRYETVLAYGPYGELYQVQVPANVRKQHKHNDGKRKEKATGSSHDDDALHTPVKVELSSVTVPTSGSERKDEAVYHIPKGQSNATPNEKNDNARIFEIRVEDVTDEELFDGISTKWSNFVPGPGESWMEPVEYQQ
jgi:hypothetical protein